MYIIIEENNIRKHNIYKINLHGFINNNYCNLKDY